MVDESNINVEVRGVKAAGEKVVIIEIEITVEVSEGETAVVAEEAANINVWGDWQLTQICWCIGSRAVIFGSCDQIEERPLRTKG